MKRGGSPASTQGRRSCCSAPPLLPRPAHFPHEPQRGPLVASCVQRMAGLQLPRGWFRGEARVMPRCHPVKLVLALLFIFSFIFSRYCFCSPPPQPLLGKYTWSRVESGGRVRRLRRTWDRFGLRGQVCLKYPLRLPPGKRFHCVRIFLHTWAHFRKSYKVGFGARKRWIRSRIY